MEVFRRKVIIRIVLAAAAAVIAAMAIVYNEVWLDPAQKAGRLFEFQYGLTWGAGLLAILAAAVNAAALRSERSLQLALNRSGDERIKAIKAKAGAPVILVTSVLMIGAGIIAGYFNEAVFVTLAAAGAAQLTLACGIKIYYMKTM